MALNPGEKLGPYQIVSLLGVGGMGEVYRARDTKLNRDVALKVIPEAFSRDAERMARFYREAQVLASLNHPNIASIYGLEDSGSQRALVMELVEGQTLAERIVGRGLKPAPTDEALKIAKQIAEALEYAHERGIIHRDLKPANIKITSEGAVKVLDFGLAKALSSEPSDTNIANSPTISIAATQAGVILGTAAYMSPEQAKGKSVDRRTDIWAFGCVLYEMLTGSQGFAGETVSDVLAAIIMREPDWGTLPASTPPVILKLLRRCLEKDPRRRIQAIGEARIALEDALSGTGTVTQTKSHEAELASNPLPTAPRALPWLLATVAGIAAVILAVALWQATRPVEKPLTRLRLDLGPQALYGKDLTAAISPDGRRLVFAEVGPDSKGQLATLLLDQSQPTLLPGTENASYPFFSTDGQWVGFFGDGELKKVSVEGGAPIVLCAVNNNSMGASWGEDGYIYVASGSLFGLSRIAASGGPLEPFTKLAPGEITHRWPQVLPGAKALLFTSSPSPTSQDSAKIRVISLKTGEVKTIQNGGYYGRYIPGGYLVYVEKGVLYCVPFDLDKLEVKGLPVPILDDVASNSATGGGQFDFSNTGTFVYRAGKPEIEGWQVSMVDGTGKAQPVLPTLGTYATPRLSPDGRKVAYLGANSEVYIYDLERKTTSRLTFTGLSLSPIWAPDSKHLIYRTTGEDFRISWIRSDGAGEAQLLFKGKNVVVPWAFAPDGRTIVYFENSPGTDYDLWTLPLDISDPDHPKAGKPVLLLSTPAAELVPRISPDGRWITYRSNDSGRDEIYVRPFPDVNGGKWQISTNGGLYGIWAMNGHELFYETTDYHINVMDFSVEGGSFIPGRSHVWYDKPLFYAGTSNFDLAPDGKHIIVLTEPENAINERRSAHVTVLLNFEDEIKRRLAK